MSQIQFLYSNKGIRLSSRVIVSLTKKRENAVITEDYTGKQLAILENSDSGLKSYIVRLILIKRHIFVNEVSGYSPVYLTRQPCSFSIKCAT